MNLGVKFQEPSFIDFDIIKVFVCRNSCLSEMLIWRLLKVTGEDLNDKNNHIQDKPNENPDHKEAAFEEKTDPSLNSI